MRTSVLDVQKKNFGLFKIYDVSAWTRGGVWVSANKGGGSIFRKFVRTSFMDGP